MSRELFKRITVYLNQPVKNRNLKYGVPFFAFMGISLLVLSQVATVRYEFRKTKPLDREEMKRLGIKVPERPKSLEEAYEEYKKIDIDNWENIRGPRLWDETPSN